MLLIYWPPWIWKSTIWATLAHMEWKTHIDTDQVFVGKYGDIARYMVDRWEDEFRKREWEILQDCLSRWNAIITLGGWTLLRPENQVLADRSWNLITLMADIETIVNRIMKDTKNTRPLISTETDIRNLMAERYAHYISQQVIYNIWKSESPEDIASKIQQLYIR